MDEQAIDWARGIFGGAQITPVRSRPWSDIGEVILDGRRWWLKINKAGTVYETRLLGLLQSAHHPLVPEAIVHPDQPWSLIADAGRRLDHLELDRDQQLAIWLRVLPPYAELQRSVPVDELLAAGVPDFRPQLLPTWYGDLVSEIDADPAARKQLTDAEYTKFVGLGPWINELVAELAAGVPATLQHDDLHEGNVLATDDLERLRVIDWGDSVISHPFSTLRVTIGRLARHLGIPDDDPDLIRLIDAYLEPWRGEGWSNEALLRQVRAGYLLGALNRVYANLRAADDLSEALDPDQPGDCWFWIREMITDAESG
jgi:hypothetical protein